MSDLALFVSGLALFGSGLALFGSGVALAGRDRDLLLLRFKRVVVGSVVDNCADEIFGSNSVRLLLS